MFKNNKHKYNKNIIWKYVDKHHNTELKELKMVILGERDQRVELSGSENLRVFIKRFFFLDYLTF